MTSIQVPKFTLSHIGINGGNDDEAKNIANLLVGLFGFETYELPESIYAGKTVEILKFQGAGKRGHIGFYTENPGIAAKYLEEKGVEFNYESAQYNADGDLILVFMEQEIGGFAIHLTCKILA